MVALTLNKRTSELPTGLHRHSNLDLIIEEERDNVVELKLAHSGDGGDHRTWLEKLEDGEVFLAKPKPTPQNPVSYMPQLFQRIGKTEKTVILVSPDLPKKVYAEPGPFCNQFILVESLGVIFEKEAEDGDNRSDGGEQTPTVE